jgi:predicted dehydrogenase
MPAYRKAGWKVSSVFDLDMSRAEAVARDFGAGRVCSSLDEAVSTAGPDAVFDLALPASATLGVLSSLPDGSHALVQKPLGENLEQATAIRDACRRGTSCPAG